MGEPKDPEAKATYWKEKFESVSEEFSEFQTSSREYESELELQLEQQEKQLKDAKAALERQGRELDTIKERYSALHSESNTTTTNLVDQLSMVRGERDEALNYIRELEQLNDDLERAKRSAIASLEDFEKRMNETLERNALLESELDEKENLVISVQRLKDETKDLKQELQVRTTKRSNRLSSSSITGVPPALATSIEQPADSTTSTLNGSPPQSTVVQRPSSFKRDIPPPPGRDMPRSHTITDGVAAEPPKTPLTPASRISALNIVGDLLRRVGALESKLATCRKFSDAAEGSSTRSNLRRNSKAAAVAQS